MQQAQPPASHAAVPQLPGLEALPELRHRIRRHVDEAIRYSMPAHQKMAYMEAVARVPRLVVTETDPLQFVRYCGYDVWAGAERLCRYWTERKALFGPDRAFLPLTLTGRGALSSDDVLSLHAGWPAILPDTATGKKAVLFDRRKWLPNVSIESRLRCLFYIMRVLASDDSSQVDGVLILTVLVTPRLRPDHWPYMHRAMGLGANAFPVKFDFHVFNTPNQKKQYLVQDIMDTASKLVLHHFKKGVTMHTEREPEQVLQSFFALGMDSEGIPQVFGGQWKFEDFFKWCLRQADIERHEHDGETVASAAAAAEGGGDAALNKRALAAVASSDAKSSNSNNGNPAITEEERAAKRRMVDLIHSRRKRERKRAEVATLESESTQLKQENRQLKTENRRLERLLRQAEEYVSRLK